MNHDYHHLHSSFYRSPLPRLGGGGIAPTLFHPMRHYGHARPPLPLQEQPPPQGNNNNKNVVEDTEENEEDHQAFRFARGSAIFPFPSVLDAATLASLLRRRTSLLVDALVQQQAPPPSIGTLQPTYREHIRQSLEAEFASLLHCQERQIERYVWGEDATATKRGGGGGGTVGGHGKWSLKSDRCVTCLVPFRVAVNFLLKELPQRYRSQVIAQLQEDEVAAAPPITNPAPLTATTKGPSLQPTKGTPVPQRRKSTPYRWVSYVEWDHYGCRADMTRGSPRIPIFAVAGHIDHGKTTLLDQIHGGRVTFTGQEAGGISQTVRSFTIPLTNVSEEEGDPKDDGCSLITARAVRACEQKILYRGLGDSTALVSPSLHDEDSSVVTRVGPAVVGQHQPDDGTVVLRNNVDDDAPLTMAIRDPPLLHPRPWEGGVPSIAAFRRALAVRGTLPHLPTLSSAANVPPPPACDEGDDAEVDDVLYPSVVTLLDTPGHRIFAELRLHTILASDFVLLVIALDTGIQSQTKEIVKVALNADKPILVLFNKIDVFTDPVSGGRAVDSVVQQLKEIGLDVTLCGSMEDIARCALSHVDRHDDERKEETKKSSDKDCDSAAQGEANENEAQADVDSFLFASRRRRRRHHRRRQQRTTESSATSSTSSSSSNDSGAATPRQANTTTNSAPPPAPRWNVFFHPQKKVDPTFLGSLQDPSMNVRRRAVGICLSASRRWNFPLLASLLQWAARVHTPRAEAGPQAAVQALVLESSKQLYEAESSSREVNPKRQQWDRQDRQRHHQRRVRYEAKTSVKGRMMHLQRSQLSGAADPTKTNKLVLQVVVKSGILTKGMPFVAEQCVGKVERMEDVWGRPVAQALPGTAVLLYDFHNHAGCPGAGVHVLGMPSSEEAARVYDHRVYLQWYVSLFPTHVELLRPRGMSNSTFQHLGNYGQLGDQHKSLAVQLLFGPPAAAPSSPASMLAGDDGKATIGNAGAPPLLGQQERVESVGEYFQTINRESQLEEEASSSASLLPRRLSAEGTDTTTELANSPNTSTTTSGTSDDNNNKLEVAWAALQPRSTPQTQEAYEQFAKSCLQVGVFLKVDSWHSGRMLDRELSRLGTSRVRLATVSVRFGPITPEDYLFVSGAVKVILCYRTPPAESVDLEKMMAVHNPKFLETNVFSEAVLFLKRCAVEMHWEAFGELVQEEVDAQQQYMTQLLEGTHLQRRSGKKENSQAQQQQQQGDDTSSAKKDLTMQRRQRLACNTNAGLFED